MKPIREVPQHVATMLLVIILLNIGLFILANQRDSLKQEAVDRGFAEWELIEGTKDTRFKWKE